MENPSINGWIWKCFGGYPSQVSPLAVGFLGFPGLLEAWWFFQQGHLLFCSRTQIGFLGMLWGYVWNWLNGLLKLYKCFFFGRRWMFPWMFWMIVLWPWRFITYRSLSTTSVEPWGTNEIRSSAVVTQLMTMGLSENGGFTGKNRANSREVLEYWNTGILMKNY